MLSKGFGQTDNLRGGLGDCCPGTRGLTSLSCGNGLENKEKLQGRKAANAAALPKGTRDARKTGPVGQHQP